MTKILLADDEMILRRILYEELTGVGYSVTTVKDGEQASKYCQENIYDLVILDIQMPKKSGIDILKEIRLTSKDAIVIMITAFGTIDSAVEAMKRGANDYITKPFDNDEFLKKIEQHIKIKKCVSSIEITSNKIDVDLFGNNNLIKTVKEKINKIKDLNVTVLITGESGTGKGVVAKEIHKSGNRRNLPFVHVDCASLPENLIESELFGYEKGAFTSAVASKKGKFELAGKGTIFLDEIGTLPLNLQSKLLNVLQEKSIDRIGGIKKIPMEARVIAATNENLEKNIEEGLFREDLYYRVNVVRIEMPPLRYRKDDIVNLAKLFIRRSCNAMQKKIFEVDVKVFEVVQNYSWPGNVRELENAIESAVALCDENILKVIDLPLKITQNKNNKINLSENNKLSLKQQEMLTIISALEKNDGHREKTAYDLGISRRGLQYKLKRLNLDDGEE